MSDTPRTDVAQHNMGSVAEPHYVVDADFSRYLERELVEAMKDAERYRWLRKGGIDHLLHGRLEELDAAIDAAMKEGGK
jgi:hypothetical protein